MALNIQRGPTREPLRLLVHGVSGIGKTTFAAAIPNAVCISAEDGGGDLDIARLPVDSWPAALRAVADLLREPHEFETVVIDTISTMERLCHTQVVADAKAVSIDEAYGGYGRGYTAAVTEQERLLRALDELRARRRMNVVLLCHTHIKRFDDPRGLPYDRYMPAMNEKAAKLWMAWADDVLFANYEIRVKADGNAATAKKGKARDEVPDRVLYTETRPAFDAKNRHGLPFDLPLDWPEFAAAVRWTERTSAARGVTRSTPPAPEPTSADLRAACVHALRELNWTNEDVSSLLAQFGATKLDDIPVSHRAEVLSAFRVSRNK